MYYESSRNKEKELDQDQLNFKHSKSTRKFFQFCFKQLLKLILQALILKPSRLSFITSKKTIINS